MTVDRQALAAARQALAKADADRTRAEAAFREAVAKHKIALATALELKAAFDNTGAAEKMIAVASTLRAQAEALRRARSSS